MVDNPLTEACRREIKRHVKRVLNSFPRGRNARHFEFQVPYIGGNFYGQKFDELKQQVYAALCARKRFQLDAPHWAPSLPLHEEDCAYLQQSADNRQKLVGYYGTSLRHLRWDYDTHPTFAAYCAGVLHVPGRLAVGPTEPYAWRSEKGMSNNDPGLEAEFPPRFLHGLESNMVWYPDWVDLEWVPGVGWSA